MKSNKFNTLFILFLLFNTNILAQTNIRDSIETLLRGIEKQPTKFTNDTLKIKYLYDLSAKYYFRTNQVDSMIILGKQIKEIGEKWNWNKGKFWGEYMLGLAYKSKGELFESIERQFKALIYAEQINDLLLQGNATLEIANCHHLLQQFPKANLYFLKAIEMFKKVNESSRLANCYNNLASSYMDNSEFNKVLPLLDLSEKIYKKLAPNPVMLGGINQNRGITYMELGNYIESEKYLTIAKSYYEEYGRRYFIAKNHSRFSQLFLIQKRYLEAIYHANLAIKIAKQSNEEKQIIESFEVAYKCYKILKRTDDANRILEEWSNLKDEINEQSISKKISATKFEYDIVKQKEFAYLQQIQLDTERKNNIYLIIGLIGMFLFLTTLYLINRRINKQKREIESQRNELDLSKKLLEDLNLNLEFKVQQRTKELSEANELLITKNREIEEALFKGQSIERRRLANELHDNLGGHITAIKWSMLAIDVDKLTEKEGRIYQNVLKMIGEAYEEVRFISHNLLPDEFNKDGLKGALTKLFTSLNTNPKTEFRLNIATYESKNAKLEFEIYSLLLEILNNIIKHADASFVYLSIDTVHKDKVEINIENNGKVFDPTNFDGSSGHGMKNLNERIKNLNANINYKLLGKSNKLNLQIITL